MKKFLIINLIVLSASINLFAQKSEILLPDLTTEIESESKLIIPEVKIEVTDTLEIPSGAGNYDARPPKLPEAPVPIIEEVKLPGEISVEGKLGAGLPYLFFGELSVGQKEIENLWNIDLDYDTQKQYAQSGYSSGFFDQKFSADAVKEIHTNNTDWKLTGSFSDIENGFQGKMPGAFSYSKDLYSGQIEFSARFEKGFSIKTKGDLNFYNRFSDSADFCKNSFSTSPEFKILWNYKNFQTNVNIQYSYENGFGSNNHRGQFGVGLSWANDIVKVFGNACVLIGNQIGPNSILVPFSAGTEIQIPVNFSEKNMALSLQGGLKSEYYTTEVYEKSNFVIFNNLPKEQTAWYGSMNFVLPVKSFFELNADFGYYHPAFENSFCILDKNNPVFVQFTNPVFRSEETVKITSGIMNLNIGWISYFGSEKSALIEQLVKAALELNFKKAGFGASMELPVISPDATPIFGFSGYVNISSSVIIEVNVEDTVKLISGTSRLCNGPYVGRSGNASLLVKFKF